MCTYYFGGGHIMWVKEFSGESAASPAAVFAVLAEPET
jgi:hypothetical protein